MAEGDWTPIGGGGDPGEGLYGSEPVAMGWGHILADTIDMYGGVGGQMMAQGGVTGMPAPDSGSSGSVIPGAGGGSSTPPNRDNELLNPHGLPVPSWTPHQGHGPNFAVQSLLDAEQAAIASAAKMAPRQVNSGMWGVPGTGWSWTFPTHPWTTKWFGPQKVAADKYQTMPTKHRTGEQVDPYFEIHPTLDWTNDFNSKQSPYEYYDWPFPDNQITPIVTHRQAIVALRSGDMNAWYDYMNQRIPGPANPLDENWPGEDYYWGAGDFANS